jgi:hypothetical protein
MGFLADAACLADLVLVQVQQHASQDGQQQPECSYFSHM